MKLFYQLIFHELALFFLGFLLTLLVGPLVFIGVLSPVWFWIAFFFWFFIGFVLYVLGKRRLALVNTIINLAQQQIKGSSAQGLTVRNILWYGAVDINPRYCVIWFILEGEREEQLPPYLSDLQNGAIEEGLCDWLVELKAQLLALFYQSGWSRYYAEPMIGFEAMSRSGGPFYFQ